MLLEQEDVDAWLADPRSGLLLPAADDVLQQWLVVARMNSGRCQEPGSRLSPSPN